MKSALWPIALFLFACGSSDAPTSGPMERPRGVNAPAETPAPKPTAPKPAAAVEEATPIPEQAPLPAAAEEKKDEAPPRDYPAELLAALGAPVDCLHPRSGADVPSELHVDVQVYLLETGFVSRAYARSPSLDAAETQCLTKRASSLRLRGPIEDAPRSVSTTLTLTLQRAEKPAAEKAPEAPEPETNANP